MRPISLFTRQLHLHVPSSVKQKPKMALFFFTSIVTGSYIIEPYMPYSLNYAIRNGKINHVEGILKDPNTNLLKKDGNGNTPLHNAVLAVQKAKNEQQKNTQMKIALIVLDYVDCLNVCNNSGQTPGCIASEMTITAPLADKISFDILPLLKQVGFLASNRDGLQRRSYIS